MVPLDKKRKTTYENWNIRTPEGRKEHFGQADHVRVYGLDYEERLKQVGFTVKKVPSWEPIDSLEHYGFLDEDIYVCFTSRDYWRIMKCPLKN